MKKFGDLVKVNTPVLIEFYEQWDDEREKPTEFALRDVVTTLGDSAKVIKIDIQKNETLVRALNVRANPTYFIYKNGAMKWKHSGAQDANVLISLVRQYL